jgi:hypothetical protein
VDSYNNEKATFLLTAIQTFGSSRVLTQDWQNVHIIDLSLSSFVAKFFKAYGEKTKIFISQETQKLHDCLTISNNGANIDREAMGIIIDLCITPLSGLFDLSDVSAEEMPVFREILENSLRNFSFCQRILTLLVAKGLNRLSPSGFPINFQQLRIRLNSRKTTCYDTNQHIVYIASEYCSSTEQLCFALYTFRT